MTPRNIKAGKWGSFSRAHQQSRWQWEQQDSSVKKKKKHQSDHSGFIYPTPSTLFEIPQVEKKKKSLFNLYNQNIKREKQALSLARWSGATKQK